MGANAMQTNVQETSIQCYHSHQQQFKTQEEIIYDWIATHNKPAPTRREIAKAINLETSSVAGRVNELLAKKLIEESGKRKCSITGIRASTLIITPTQKKLFN